MGQRPVVVLHTTWCALHQASNERVIDSFSHKLPKPLLEQTIKLAAPHNATQYTQAESRGKTHNAAMGTWEQASAYEHAITAKQCVCKIE